MLCCNILIKEKIPSLYYSHTKESVTGHNIYNFNVDFAKTSKLIIHSHFFFFLFISSWIIK